ncbi:MAG TPA: hypothetical protein QF458_01330, partial [Candidatus Woesearchaeota archaeon]|nr:hypothetical protein [Candidatus Woesearchaeota archaeon]
MTVNFEVTVTSSLDFYRKLEVDYLLQKLKVKREKILFADSHHLAHATSSYYPSNFDEAAILIID